jgi:mRNA-degrading endonuclease toxin of MazEF toxin-antitoxin module
VRPALALIGDRLTACLQSVLVAPLTTGVRGIPTEVELDTANEPARSCASNLPTVFTLRRDRSRERIARLSATRLEQACRSYRCAAGC